MRSETTHIRVATAVKDRIERLAGDKGMAKFLDTITVGYVADRPLPFEELPGAFTLKDIKQVVGALRDSYDKQYNNLVDRMDIIEQKCDIIFRSQRAMVARMEQGFQDIMCNIFNLMATSAMTMKFMDHLHPGEHAEDTILDQAPAEAERMFKEWKQGKLK